MQNINFALFVANKGGPKSNAILKSTSYIGRKWTRLLTVQGLLRRNK
jgi:hypothetical protein